MNAWDELKTQDYPNLSIARPILSCRVNPLGATTDFTQEDKLDGPSCGTPRDRKGAAAAEATAVGFGTVRHAVFLYFEVVSMVTYAV